MTSNIVSLFSAHNREDVTAQVRFMHTTSNPSMEWGPEYQVLPLAEELLLMDNFLVRDSQFYLRIWLVVGG